MAEDFDVVVIGGGPAGENAAARAVEHGLSAALVERELLGGECSYWACIPSKALLRPGEALWLARHAAGAREAVTGPLDAGAVLSRREALVSGYRDDGQARWAAGAGVTVVRGHGRLLGPRRVEVEGAGRRRQLQARRAVVLATGSAARFPDVPGLREARPWDNRRGTGAAGVPRRLLVLGGGAVAVELSQAWRSLGAEVTLVQRSRLVARAEPLVGEALEQALAADGVRLLLGVEARRVERPGGAGEVAATLSSGEVVRADELLVATGRSPRTGDLGLETVGLAAGGAVEVDDALQVRGVEGGWLYACGDVNGRNLLTHMGKYQARLAADHIAGREVRAWADHRATPQVVFTHPQAAWVGLTEARARAAGLPVQTVERDLASVAGSALLGEGVGGRAKLVVDERRRVLLGATFVGPGAGELLHAATVAVAGEVPLDTLWHAVPAFPTVSEIWLRLLEGLGL